MVEAVLGGRFPREPWEDRMPGAACAPALALLCPTLFVRPIVLLSLGTLVHTHFIKLLPCLPFKCTQVKYGSFGTRVLMGSVDVEGI